MNHADNVLGILSKLATCLEDAVDQHVSEGLLGAKLCRIGIAPGGNVSYDYVNNGRCLDNKTDGQGFVVMTGLYPSTNFPNPSVVARPCGQGDLALNVNVGIIRSYPVPGDGEPPSQDLQNAAVLQQVTEMGMIEHVLTCCFTDESDLSLLLGVYTPAGPEGGAIGGYWSATIEVAEE